MTATIRTPFAIGAVLLALAALLAAAALYRFDPAQHGFYPRCHFYALTGLQCPGCGGLRAGHALLHGQVAEAFRLNALFVASLPALLALAAWRWHLRARGQSARRPLRATWVWIFVAAVIVFGVVRNLPVVSFAWATP
jgi:hypothetical protein